MASVDVRCEAHAKHFRSSSGAYTHWRNHHPGESIPDGIFRRRNGAIPLQEGERIIVGPTPTDPVTVTVRSGRARREIIVYVLPMADVVDLISGALREAIPSKRK